MAFVGGFYLELLYGLVGVVVVGWLGFGMEDVFAEVDSEDEAKCEDEYI